MILELPIFGNFNVKTLHMGKNTSISLGTHFEEFIHEEVSSGRYGSASEVIRTALRLLENEEKKINELRQALILGEESGWVKNFNPEDHLKSIKSRHTTK